jgi:hypothetical protein
VPAGGATIRWAIRREPKRPVAEQVVGNQVIKDQLSGKPPAEDG